MNGCIRRGFVVVSAFAMGLALALGGNANVSPMSNAADVGATTTRAAAKFHCAMHPDVTSSTAGRCPICQLDLVESEAPSAPPATTQAQHQHGRRGPLDDVQPTQTAPEDGVQITKEEQEIVLEWAKVDKAAAYHIEVQVLGAGDKWIPLFEDDPIRTEQIRQKILLSGPSSHRWRVTAIAASGEKSKPSAWRMIVAIQNAAPGK